MNPFKEEVIGSNPIRATVLRLTDVVDTGVSHRIPPQQARPGMSEPATA